MPPPEAVAHGGLSLPEINAVIGQVGSTDTLYSPSSGPSWVIGQGGSDYIYGSAQNDRLAPGTDGSWFSDSLAFPEVHWAPGAALVDGAAGIDSVVLDYCNTSTALNIDVRLFAGPAGTTLADGCTIRNVEAALVYGSSAGDLVIGGDFDDGFFGDNLCGYYGADTIIGGGGNDALYALSEGGIAFVAPGVELTAADYLDGGAGNDYARLLYFTSNVNGYSAVTSDIVIDLTGAETAMGVTLFDGKVLKNIERVGVVAGAGNDSITGGSGNDDLVGMHGNDTIDGGSGDDDIGGGGGDDRLFGGAGNDTFFDHDGGDTVVYAGNRADYRAVEINLGSEEYPFLYAQLRHAVAGRADGIDLIYSQIDQVEFADGTWTLAEVLALSAENSGPVARNDVLTFTEREGWPDFQPTFTGNILADNGSGADEDIDADTLTVTSINGLNIDLPMFGGLGSKQVVLDSGVRVTFFSDGSFVAFGTSAVFDLNQGQSLTYTLTYTISDGYGGTSEATATLTFHGSTRPPPPPPPPLPSGEDIVGTSRNDRLVGTSVGEDLIGAGGRDTLTGGGGADDFVYRTRTDSGFTSATRDVITDFRRGVDDIDLRLIDANTKAGGNQAFKFIGAQSFHKKPGELHFRDAGLHVIVEGDVNGDGRADFAILVQNVSALSAGDFIL
jgi:Ca2+-binding RTX toxin-like protein